MAEDEPLFDRRSTVFAGAALAMFLLVIYVVVRCTQPSRPGQELRSAAEMLRARGMAGEAASLYETYAAEGRLDAISRAGAYYAAAELYMQAREYESALRTLHLASAAGAARRVEEQIPALVMECLTQLGRDPYAATNAPGAPASAPSAEVVARVGNRQITRREVEAAVATASPGARERLAAPEGRREIVKTLVVRELLYQRGLREGLPDEPSVQRQVEETTRAIVIQAALAREIDARVRIEPEEVKAYFETHTDRFVRPAQARVTVVARDSQKDAIAAATQLRANEPIGDGGDAGVEGVFRETHPIPGVGEAPGLAAKILKASAGSVIDPERVGDRWYVVVVQEVTPSRQLTFEEAREACEAALRQERGQAAYGEFIEELLRSGDVQILSGGASSGPAPPDGEEVDADGTGVQTGPG